jgi:pimeloyl-ACP methyl ester carboxylesterase
MTATEYGRANFDTPEPSQRLRELRTPIEPVRLLLQSPRILLAPRGDGRRLVAIPGYGAPDGSLAPLRGFLASRNHRPHGWGLGVNRGDVGATLPHLIELVRTLAEESGRSVNLVGWSLGGVFAREIARDHPTLVHRVATLGTPLYGPRHTLTRRVYSDDELAEIEAQIDARSALPITRPVRAIYSRNDGVVDWRACVDHVSPDVDNVEVTSSHFGIGIDPDVWRSLAEWFVADGRDSS